MAGGTPYALTCNEDQAKAGKRKPMEKQELTEHNHYTHFQIIIALKNAPPFRKQIRCRVVAHVHQPLLERGCDVELHL